MKYNVFVLFCILLFYPLLVTAQIDEKINIGITFSSAFHHYEDMDVNNPYYAGVNLSYEIDFSSYFGIQLGLKAGGFRQEIGYDYDLFVRKQILCNGSYYTPYLAPIVYLPVWYNEKLNQSSNLFLKFSPYYGRVALKSTGQMKRSKFHFDYDIQLGYQYPITDRWFIQAWVGYTSFDYGAVAFSPIDLKTSTPLDIGLGVCFSFKR